MQMQPCITIQCPTTRAEEYIHTIKQDLPSDQKLLILRQNCFYNLAPARVLGLSLASRTGFQAGPSSVSLKGLRCATSSRLRYTSPSFLHSHKPNEMANGQTPILCPKDSGRCQDMPPPQFYIPVEGLIFTARCMCQRAISSLPIR